MRFDSVTAYAFGPFRGETLQLAPGMNVVYGPNEAGKSTWHAALYAGLCGMRRSRGQPRREDREFEERRRPWDGDGAWEVGAVIRLEDGRRVQLRHDLAGRVDSSARDVDFAGRDYSNEIMNEGSPDGARWLGLGRQSFLSTACVRQAAILGLLEDAANLQDELQRAAATAGTDETAADALQRLRDFHGEHVGSERAWTKPRYRAREAVDEARRELDRAREAHQQYLERSSEVEEAEAHVHTLERQTDAARAVLAQAEASRAEGHVGRARELSARLPEGPPRRAAEEDRVTQDVATALEAWRSRPDQLEPGGPTIEELETQLAEIDKELVSTKSTPRSSGQGRRRSNVWPLAGAGGVVAGGALALVGFVVPGAILILIALALLAWRALIRPTTAEFTETDRYSALDAQRAHVAHLIDDRRDAERTRAEAARQRDEAAEAVRRAALATGVDANNDEARAEGLLAWQARRIETLAEADLQRASWEELQRLLGERSIEELSEEEARLRAEAESLVALADPTALVSVREQAMTAEKLEEMWRQIRVAREEWRTAGGQLAQFARDLPNVAEAEEMLASAERELERVDRLDRALGTTIEFLKRAEERVHRDIAPVLRETVLAWLPRVTGGRYTDCRVNPQTLAVEVCGPGGRWRRADLLSHGAAEQLYLLLRFALAQHLTKPGEVCPLILDDTLAACDGARKREVLESLLAVSESVQVILFSHEEDVRDWARDRLSEARDSLTEIDAAGVPT